MDMNSWIASWRKHEGGSLPGNSASSPLAASVRMVFLILIPLSLCTFTVFRGLVFRDVNHQFAQIRAAGFPASGAELNAWREAVSDKENGALVLTQAFALYRTFPDRRSNEIMEAEILSRTNAWTSVRRELVEAYVATNSPAIAKAREALRLPYFRFPVDFSYGPDTPLRHLGRLREISRIFALQAALNAENGKADEWPACVELQLELAGTLDDEPILISHLARNGIIDRAVKVTERSLNRATPGDDFCGQLQTAFTRISEKNLLPDALVGERAIMIPIFRLSWDEIQSFSQNDPQVNRPREPQPYSGKPAAPIWLSGIMERDLDFYLATMEKCIALANLPPPENLAMSNYVETASENAHKRACMLSGMLLPSLSRLAQRDASTLARIQITIAALAIERFRLAQGRLPKDLGELVPKFLDAIPNDPFDGAPLRYKRLAVGYVVYSVDADGRDDGGREAIRRKGTDETTSDITFIVEH
jgi:hypothetical protein